MTEDQIKHMVDRFLGWRLPQPWHPDAGISYQRPNYAHPPAEHDWPTGTNLFDASQADAMVRYMLKGMPLSVSTGTMMPCPFCGGEPIVASDMGDWSIRCADCGVMVLRHRTRTRAEAAWNRRLSPSHHE